jgi:hypothetical protein
MKAPLAEDCQLLWRLAAFKANNPDVQVGCEWRARVPRPRARPEDVVCNTLQELLDELDKRSLPPAVRRSRTRRGGP